MLDYITAHVLYICWKLIRIWTHESWRAEHRAATRHDQLMLCKLLLLMMMFFISAILILNNVSAHQMPGIQIYQSSCLGFNFPWCQDQLRWPEDLRWEDTRIFMWTWTRRENISSLWSRRSTSTKLVWMTTRCWCSTSGSRTLTTTTCWMVWSCWRPWQRWTVRLDDPW